MKAKQPSHAISGVFVFLLLGMFAVFSTVMVLMGAKAYRATAEHYSAHNAERIGPAYVRSMVRANDEKGAVRVEEIDGLSVLTIENRYEDEVYLTRIYACDGMLREWYADGESEFEPQDGEEVCPADEFSAAVSGGLLTVRLRRGDEWITLDMALRSGAGEVSL